MTKQGGYKIVNNLVNLGVLIVDKAKSGNKIFDVNKEIIKYNFDNILK